MPDKATYSLVSQAAHSLMLVRTTESSGFGVTIATFNPDNQWSAMVARRCCTLLNRHGDIERGDGT